MCISIFVSYLRVLQSRGSVLFSLGSLGLESAFSWITSPILCPVRRISFRLPLPATLRGKSNYLLTSNMAAIFGVPLCFLYYLVYIKLQCNLLCFIFKFYLFMLAAWKFAEVFFCFISRISGTWSHGEEAPEVADTLHDHVGVQAGSAELAAHGSAVSDPIANFCTDLYPI